MFICTYSAATEVFLIREQSFFFITNNLQNHLIYYRTAKYIYFERIQDDRIQKQKNANYLLSLHQVLSEVSNETLL